MELSTFLKNKDAYDLFVQEFDKTYIQNYLPNYKTDTDGAIHAFSWSRSKNGYDFWDTIDTEWINYQDKNHDMLELFNTKSTKQIPTKLYAELERLGIMGSDIRTTNVGTSNYSKHVIQPWSIIQDWNLDYWDGDIIKRILRTKSTDSRALDYEKIKHICDEKLRQIAIKDTN